MEIDEKAMDMDEAPLDDYCEEGEISSSDDEKNVNVKISSNVSSVFTRNYGRDQTGGFVTGINIFDKDEALKKLDRAKRFALPVQTNNSEELHKEQLSNLYRDLGIDNENERHYRFNVIHMRGTEDMSTNDVFQYFTSYAPSHVEWINDVSCNIVLMDDISAARALLNLSKKIRNLDKVHLNADPFEKDFKENSPADEVMDDESVDARDIKAAIPPGFWRIGLPSEKNSLILLRFATRSDKKQRNAEKISEYYKKYGNPNYGNIPGIISNSLRTEIRKSRYKGGDFNNIWKNNKQEVGEKKNPWEDLAYEWGKTDRVEESHGKYVRSKISQQSALPTYKSDVPDLRISLTSKKERGKRLRVDSDDSPDSPDTGLWESKSKVPRMKMYADDEEKKIEKNSDRLQGSRYPARKPVEDLRSKITKKKNKQRFKFKSEKKNQFDSSSASVSESEFDDGDSGDWALEHYHDLRESLEQSKKQGNSRFNRGKYESDSENSDVDQYIYDRNSGKRSTLQIEIDNDEYYLNKD